jgi:biopolymer transport protein ExbD
MRKKTRRRGGETKGTLNMGAMLDVVFLLLIYFIVTAAPTLTEGQFRADLPSPVKGTPPPPTVKSPPLVVDVMPEGYRIQNTFRDRLSLRDDLVMIATFNPETTVVIRVHPEALNEQVHDLLENADFAGLPNVAFAGAPPG